MTGVPAKTIVVAGATGRFGAIAQALLARGHHVRALTRTPDSPAAMSLRNASADVVRADFDDNSSIVGSARGADAMFATGTAHRVGPEGELRHGMNVAGAVATAAIGHLVFVSGDGAAADSPLPLFRAKHRVEERIRAAAVPHTILAPVYLMENLFNPWNLPLLRAGLFPSPIPVDQPMQQVAVADVVALAVTAIENPSEFAGRRIPIASDELSANVGADTLAREIRRPLVPQQLDAEDLPPGVSGLFAWLERNGHSVDLASLQGDHQDIGWHSYADWVRSVTVRFRDFCPHPAPVGP